MFKGIDVFDADNFLWKSIPAPDHSWREELIIFPGSMLWFYQLHAVPSCPFFIEAGLQFQEVSLQDNFIQAMNVAIPKYYGGIFWVWSNKHHTLVVIV